MQTHTQTDSTLRSADREQSHPSFEEQYKRVALDVMHIGNHAALQFQDFAESPLGHLLTSMMKKGEELVFLLPAFPAKSSNPDKTECALPDLGEYLALSRLDEMCSSIKSIYKPGAKIIICSDGRVFNDIVMVSDEDLSQYTARIKQIIESEKMVNLETFSLDDCHDMFDDLDNIREELVNRYGPSVDDIRKAASEDPSLRCMINGIHRFMKEDLAASYPTLSRNQLMLRSKKVAYRVVQRSRSWDGLLKLKFPNTLRLSIHPYPITNRKFGVKLVQSSDKWATPWHNVTVKSGGSYTLMKKKEALALGAKLRYFKGEYAYYEAD